MHLRLQNMVEYGTYFNGKKNAWKIADQYCPKIPSLKKLIFHRAVEFHCLFSFRSDRYLKETIINLFHTVMT